MRYHFGDCLLDTAARELRRSGRLVPLKPKGFRLLEVLIERRPSAIAQAELRRLLWPDTQMGGTTLARLVSDVRTAIDGAPGAEELIRTVHRFGYAFSGWAEEEPVVTALAAHAKCSVQWGRQVLPLVAGENMIGRAPEADVSIGSPQISRRHARITISDDRAILEDLGSRNGTFVSERRICGPVELKHRDRIGIGPALLIFYVSGSDETTETAA